MGRRFHPGAARQLREQPSLADRLLSPDPDERTAALALLMRRGGADADVAALLRWATTRPEGELALAATVALAHEQPLLAGGTHAGLGDRGGVRAPGRLLPLRRQTAPARGHSCAELDAPCGEASAATG